MSGTRVRSLHYSVEFDGNTSALEEWNKKLLESKKDGDMAAGSISKMEKEMMEYAQKIGLSRTQMERLSKTSIKDQKINEFSKQYGFAAGDVKRLANESENASGKLGKLGSAFKAFAAAAALATAISISGGMVSKAAQFEQTKISFEVMLQSADKAKQTLQDLKQFSDISPFTSEKVIESGRALIAYGVKPGEQLKETLQLVGDVAAGVGMDFGELSNIVGKNLTQGVVQTEDLMQLAGRGVPIFDSMAKVFGTTTDQVKTLASTGQIKFDHLKEAFKKMTGEGGMYFGMMKKLSESALGLWSTFNSKTDELKKTLGEMLLQALKPMLSAAIQFMDWLNKSPAAMNVVKGIMVAIIPIIGVLAVGAVMSLASAFGAMAIDAIVALWPLYLICAAIGAIGLVVQDLYVWLNGGNSAIGEWVEKTFGSDTAKSVQKTIMNIVSFIKAGFNFVVENGKKLIEFLKTTFGPLISTIRENFGPLFSSIVIILSTLWTVLKPILKVVFIIIGAVIFVEIKIIKTMITIQVAIARFLVWGITKIVEFIAWLCTAIPNGISWLINKVRDYGKYIIMALFPFSLLYFYWDEIIKWIKGWPDKIIEIFINIKDKVKAILKDLTPEWMQKGFSLITSKFGGGESVAGARASGGDVDAGKLYRVNENGEEFFRPRMSGTIIPVGAGGRASRSVVFAPVVNIHINGSADNPQSIAQAVKDALYEILMDARIPLGLGEA